MDREKKREKSFKAGVEFDFYVFEISDPGGIRTASAMFDAYLMSSRRETGFLSLRNLFFFHVVSILSSFFLRQGTYARIR